MKVLITEKQLKRLIKKTKELEIDEEDAVAATAAADATPVPGTSETQQGGQGYPEVSTWENIVGSKLARGPANQIKNTKWSDTVGAGLTRDAANQLKEQDWTGQPSGAYKRPIIHTLGSDAFNAATKTNEIPNAYNPNPSQKPLSYITFKGDKLEIPNDSIVLVWKSTDQIQKILSTGKQDNDGQWIWSDGKAGPPEEDLKRVFKSGTLREFITKKDGLRYSILMKKVNQTISGGLYGLGSPKIKNTTINEQVVPYSSFLPSGEKSIGMSWMPEDGYFANKNGETIKYNPNNYIEYSLLEKITKFSETHKGLYTLVQFATMIGIGIATGNALIWEKALYQLAGQIPFSLIDLQKGDNIGAAVGLLIMCIPLATRWRKVGISENLKALEELKPLVPKLSKASTAQQIQEIINQVGENSKSGALLTRLLRVTPKEFEKVIGTALVQGFKDKVQDGTIVLSRIPFKELYWWKDLLANGGLAIPIMYGGIKLKSVEEHRKVEKEMVNLMPEIYSTKGDYSKDEITQKIDNKLKNK